MNKTGGRKRILIVEDEESLARLMRWQLESVGYEVQTETLGTKALSYAAEQWPDLAILDLRLPDLHGYEVCRALRKLYDPWSLPIVMLTAMDKPIDQLRGYAFGADAYMTKPYEETELIKTVTLLLGEAVSA